jgi:hypothetical protein
MNARCLQLSIFIKHKAALTTPVVSPKEQIAEPRRVLAEMNFKKDRIID